MGCEDIQIAVVVYVLKVDADVPVGRGVQSSRVLRPRHGSPGSAVTKEAANTVARVVGRGDDIEITIVVHVPEGHIRIGFG